MVFCADMIHNWFKRRDPIVYYHRTMIARYGFDSSLALGWREPADQLIRFKILTEIGDLNDCTVLDAGCGYADLYPFLKTRYPQLRHYYGIEQIPELFALANHHYSHRSDVTLIKGDFLHTRLPACDYVLASGSLNYGQNIQKTVVHLFKICSVGLGFNLLQKVKTAGILKAHQPQDILSFAGRLTSKVTLINNYSDEDFTIFLHK